MGRLARTKILRAQLQAQPQPQQSSEPEYQPEKNPEFLPTSSLGPFPSISEFGFIMLRHVNSPATNLYWQESYDCIRKLYPEHTIIIIDDNSNYDFITPKELYATEIMQSPFPKRGEFLPFYFYSRFKWFDCAFILHDSVFIKKYVHVPVKNYKISWFIRHHADEPHHEIQLLNRLSHSKSLVDFYHQKHLWNGCFGGMCMIRYDYLVSIYQKYSFDNLIPGIESRFHRMNFERVIGCILQKDYREDVFLLGDIGKYCNFGQNYDTYKNKVLENQPVVKVWTGR